jgi:hypothetical protein
VLRQAREECTGDEVLVFWVEGEGAVVRGSDLGIISPLLLDGINGHDGDREMSRETLRTAQREPDTKRKDQPHGPRKKLDE